MLIWQYSTVDCGSERNAVGHCLKKSAGRMGPGDGDRWRG